MGLRSLRSRIAVAPQRRRWCRPLAAFLLVLATGAAAHADGAFPDSMALFLPADAPHRIVLATNFGLVTSDDDGATWDFICEAAIAPYVAAYQMSAPPDDTLFGETPSGLALSTDQGCSWSFATGSIAGVNVLDVFPDPNAASRLFAVTRLFGAGGTSDAVTLSTDGGHSFTAPALFTGGNQTTVTGVEVARAAPHPVYLTLFDYPPLVPRIGRSSAGAPFETIDQRAALTGDPYLAAVDPEDPQTLYLRIRGSDNDALAISHDGGQSIAAVVPMVGPMSALLRRGDGHVLVGASGGHSLRSLDGGASFAPWAAGLHVRALGERDGLLYVVANDLVDGFAMATSSDEGEHWSPVLRFRDIRGPRGCGKLPEVCAGPWAALGVTLGGADGGIGGPLDGESPPPAPPLHARGCACDVGGTPPPMRPPLGFALAAALAISWRRARAS